MNTHHTESLEAHQRVFTVAAAFSREYLQFVQDELNASIAAEETAEQFSQRLLARQPEPWLETWPVEPVRMPEPSHPWTGAVLLRWLKGLWKRQVPNH